MYSTSIIEFPFTWSNTSDNGVDIQGPVRFAPFFNLQNNMNIDFSEMAGVFIGMAIHNVGFIYDVDEFTRKKVRSYNFGIPMGIKLGNMNGTHFFGGYEVEFPFHYKEKTFINEQKDKYTTWFSKKTQLQQSFMVGVQFPQSVSLKFKYYFTNFYYQDYSEKGEDGGTVYPYENFTANIFWVSLNFELFRGTKFMY